MLSNDVKILLLLFTWDIISSKFKVLNFMSASHFSSFIFSFSSIRSKTFINIKFISSFIKLNNEIAEAKHQYMINNGIIIKLIQKLCWYIFYFILFYFKK